VRWQWQNVIGGSIDAELTRANHLMGRRLRIFTFFHPGIFTIIHPPPGFFLSF
jgi:hypothetical protein